jgi:hypothetical protein
MALGTDSTLVGQRLTLATHVHLICLAERKSDALVERFLQTAELLKPDTQPDTNKHR